MTILHAHSNCISENSRVLRLKKRLVCDHTALAADAAMIVLLFE